MDKNQKYKLFGLTPLVLERELDKIEEDLTIDLSRDNRIEKDEDYYPQFEVSLRQEASSMGIHYELFYCLERSIRNIVAETLEAEFGEEWWEKAVTQAVKDNVDKNIQREIDSAITLRSEYEIDYTTFGELGEIVRKNWDYFDAIFSSQKAFNKIMTSLNILRNPIAHCCPLADDEKVRLELTVKDWFRLME